MQRVGVRELRQRTSELLRRVQNGETLEVTDRGRPVALLTPLPEGSPIEQLRAAGGTWPAGSTLDQVPEPLDVTADETPSQVLARLRQDER